MFIVFVLIVLALWISSFILHYNARAWQVPIAFAAAVVISYFAFPANMLGWSAIGWIVFMPAAFGLVMLIQGLIYRRKGYESPKSMIANTAGFILCGVILSGIIFFLLA